MLKHWHFYLVTVALVLTQTIHAATIYDLRIYCEWAWWDVFLC